MTFVVSLRNKIAGTAQTLDGAQRIISKEFSNFCEPRNIPDHNQSGGVYLPDIREPVETDGNYARWLKSSDRNKWSLHMGNLHSEFLRMNLNVKEFEDIELGNKTPPPSLLNIDAYDHFMGADRTRNRGSYRTHECDDHDIGEIDSWQDSAGFHEVVTWRIWNQCENFRKYARSVHHFEGYNHWISGG